MLQLKTLALGALLAITSIGAFAQAATAPSATPGIDQRQAIRDLAPKA